MSAYDEFICEARCSFRGKPLHLNRIVARIELEEIMPPRGPIVDMYAAADFEQHRERRQRFVDFIAAEFAHALTEALFKAAK